MLPAFSSTPGVSYPTTPMIAVTDLRARIRRLEELSRGLGIEEERFRVMPPPMMADEQEKYREGIGQAIAGVETVRLALVMACQRIEGTVTFMSRQQST